MEPRALSATGLVLGRSSLLRGAALALVLGGLSACGGGGGGGGASKAFQTGGSLAVDPTTAFSAAGNVGGPFAPSSTLYTLSNTGTEGLQWSLSLGESWVQANRTAGTLLPGQSTDVTISLVTAQVAALPAGTHTALLHFLNETDGSGTTVRTASVTAGPGATDLVVSPLTSFLVVGSAGGTFVPEEATYTLANASGAPLSWTASKSQPWLLLSAASGTLQPGQQTAVTVALDTALLASFGSGRRTDNVVFTNVTNGDGTTIRTADVSIIESNKTFFVTPEEGLVSDGAAGGPFSPARADYAFSNLGNQISAWSATKTQPWVELSASSGQVVSGGQTLFSISIDQSVAAGLAPGTYSDTVVVTTDNAGTQARTVDLTVTGQAQGLTVSPLNGLTSTGVQGGPFAPASIAYTLTNNEPTTITWSATTAASWLDLSSAGGQLAPGGQTTLTVAVDQAVAANLGLGGNAGTVSIVNATNGLGSTTRGASLNVVSSNGSTAASLSQYGITWTFDQPYEVGQFANGDWWVVGPVTIVDINPPSVSGGREMNGSMVNPNPNKQNQSYDSTMYAQYAWPTSYEPQFNVARDVSVSNPLVLQPHKSLISTISESAPMVRPQLKAAAILTVLPSAAPAGSFRPPYCGNDKSIEFNISQLDYDKLASLQPVPGTPALATVEQWFTRPWIDHIPDWIGRYHHPSENMPDYGREICDYISTAALMLNLNFTDNQKETLLVRYVQLGIDFYGIIEANGLNNWPAGGGHHSGRKWPILFAGLMLDDFDMSNIGFDGRVAFNEDGQTFVVQETSPGVYNCGFGGYGPQHVGLVEWGNQHAKNKGQDDSTWFGNPYRTCCTANVWWGEVLAAHIMGARALWNHDPLFDYMDRYRQVAPTTGQAGWTIAQTQFQLDMWDAYRSNY